MKYTVASLHYSAAVFFDRQAVGFGHQYLSLRCRFFVLLLAGLSWRWVLWAGFAMSAAAPLIWQFVLEGYQRQRILTLFDPQVISQAGT